MLFLTEVMMLFAKLVSGVGCGLSSTHPLAFAGQLWHRVIVNHESVFRVSEQLGLCSQVSRNLLRLMRSVKGVPSAERLAVICQLDPGYDDADVGEVFGRTAEWSANVRRNAARIRAAEPIDPQLEWFDDGLKPFDPTPAEILQRALEVRSSKGVNHQKNAGIRAFAWRPRVSSFLPIRAE
jgi:hypothetical protein